VDLGLENRVVLITGGSVGIGLAVAEEFLKENARVVICARDEDRLNKAVEDLRVRYPGKDIFGKSCDVSKLPDLEQLVRYIEHTVGDINILINNAGAGSEEKNMTAPDEKWYHYWDLHVMAAIRLCRLCLPLMKKSATGGVIINTASLCAMQPLYYEPIYNVTKAALNMYTKCLADELIKDNIRVMAVSPGLVLTPDWRKTAANLSKKQGITVDRYFDNLAKEMAPIGRFSSPDEVARFYVFLASHNASYCLGTNFHVDGGATRAIN
jgi:NAD(P)-dependent dehydrogenase (short-subunit alcohol dehydrogenase family)